MIDGTGAVSTAAGSTSAFAGAQGPTTDQFLRLLLVQLQNQDPLNPVTDSDFTAQLAQFSSLEKLTQINENLLGLGGIQQGLVNAQALNLLGKEVLVSGDAPLRLAKGTADEIIVDAPANATNIKVEIRDLSGTLVRTIDVPPGTGRQSVAWDGKDEFDNVLADGEYSATVVATDVQKVAVDASLFISLRVDGVSFAGGLVQLTAGGRDLPFEEIVEIRA